MEAHKTEVGLRTPLSQPLLFSTPANAYKVIVATKSNKYHLGVSPLQVTVTTVKSYMFSRGCLLDFICHCYWEGATPKVSIERKASSIPCSFLSSLITWILALFAKNCTQPEVSRMMFHDAGKSWKFLELLYFNVHPGWISTCQLTQETWSIAAKKLDLTSIKQWESFLETKRIEMTLTQLYTSENNQKSQRFRNLLAESSTI